MLTIAFLLGTALSDPQPPNRMPEIQEIYDAGFSNPTDVAIIHMLKQYIELDKINRERVESMPSCLESKVTRCA